MNVSRAIAAIALLIITLVVIAFAVLNSRPKVFIDLGFRQYQDVPLILALFVAFVVGVILTVLYSLYYFIDMGLNVRRLKKQNRDLEQELAAIRSLSLEESVGQIKPDEGKEVPA